MIPVDGEEGPADVCVIELGGTIGKKPPRLLKKENQNNLLVGTLLCEEYYLCSVSYTT